MHKDTAMNYFDNTYSTNLGVTNTGTIEKYDIILTLPNSSMNGYTSYIDIWSFVNNVLSLLRQGIAELGSGSKSPRLLPRCSHAINPRISSL